MRTIYAEALKRLVDEEWFDCQEKSSFFDEIDRTPTIDAVPVIRCKDCKWWVERHPRLGIPWCRQTHLDREADGYCEMGKRREECPKQENTTP